MATKKKPTKKTAAKKAAVKKTTKRAAKKPAKKTGRPSKYMPEYNERANQFAKLGATDAEIAQFFGVTEQTLNNWKKAHPPFFESLNDGKAFADANVASRLYERAMGYEHDDVDIRVVNGEVVQTPIVKKYPPDTTAAIFWLKNRQKINWRDKIDHSLTGPGGGAIEHSIAVAFVDPEPRDETDDKEDA